jgi:diguanylate cyclase (GGDEF)-like protein
MQASSFALRIRRRVTVRDWLWWQQPPVLRWYVAAVSIAAVAVIGVAAGLNSWRPSDLAKFAILLCCGMVSVAATPRIMYQYPGMVRDFSTMWVLPAAVLLPPFYAAVMPIPLLAVMRWFVHRGVPHRAVFTAASIGLAYAGGSELFRLFPASFAGVAVGSGLHAVTWIVAVTITELVANRAQHFLVAGAVKLTDPTARMRDLDFNWQAFEVDFLKTDLAVLITLAVAVTPALVIVALPTVFLVRRFLEYPVLVAQSRVDAKTGLLNVSTWEREAESELSRSMRTRAPLALALVDIDHFKLVNDTHGHLVGDKVLKSVAQALTSHLRDYDRAGRFGGEEFVLLLAQTNENDACRIAERLRSHVADMVVPIDDRPNSPTVQLTISIGVTAMERGAVCELTDLLAAADSALYKAKQTGRNRIAVAAAERNMGLDADLDGQHMGDVRVDPTGASLGLARSLSVFMRARHESGSLF